MPESLRRWAAAVGKLALSAGLLWMGVDLAHAQPDPATSVDTAALFQQHCAAFHGVQRTDGMGSALLPESLERLRRPRR